MYVVPVCLVCLNDARVFGVCGVISARQQATVDRFQSWMTAIMLIFTCVTFFRVQKTKPLPSQCVFVGLLVLSCVKRTKCLSKDFDKETKKRKPTKQNEKKKQSNISKVAQKNQTNKKKKKKEEEEKKKTNRTREKLRVL